MGYRFPLQTANIVANLSFGRVYECYMEIFRNQNSYEDFLEFVDHYEEFIYSDRMGHYESVFLRAREIFSQINYKQVQVDSDEYVMFHKPILNVLKDLSMKFERCKIKALLIPSLTRKGNTREDFMTLKKTLEILVEIHPGDSCLILQPRERLNDKSIFNAFPNFDVALRQADLWPAVLFWESSEKFAFVPVSSKDDLIECFQIVKNNPNPVDELNRRANLKKHRSICLFHLSDLHFGTKEAKASESKLKELIEKETSKRVDDDVYFVITGDMINSPKKTYKDEYEAFGAFLECQNRRRPFYVLGNHDISKNGLAILHRNQRLANVIAGFPKIEILETQKIILLLFNSNTDGSLATGEIGDAQMSKMDGYLRKVENIKDYFLIAVLHHHLEPIHKPSFFASDMVEQMFGEKLTEDTMKLHDSEEFIEWLKEHNVKLVLHGHKHIPYMVEREGIRIIGCGSSTGMRKRSGTKESYLTYNLVRICGNGFTCTYFADEVSGQGPRIIHPEVGQW